MALTCSAVLVYAVPQSKPGPTTQESTTITGCLRQGSTQNSFVLAQQDNRYELIADSKTDLSKMVGREVQVTGVETVGPVNPPPSSDADGPPLKRFNVQRITETGSAC